MARLHVTPSGLRPRACPRTHTSKGLVVVAKSHRTREHRLPRAACEDAAHALESRCGRRGPGVHDRHRIAVANADARPPRAPSFRIAKALVFAYLHALFAVESQADGTSCGAVEAMSAHS